MLTVSDLLASLQEIVDEYGDLPVAVTVQPGYPIAGNIDSARITGPTGADKKLYLFAQTTEYGPSFYEGDDDQNVETIL